jgi:hypothetical protein
MNSSNEFPPFDADHEKFPNSPIKEDPTSMYVDEGDIVRDINKAIDLARLGYFDDAEGYLSMAMGEISQWEPYDTSDCFKGMGWENDVKKVQAYMAKKKSEE